MSTKIPAKNNTFINEHDEELTRRFGDKYSLFKEYYPDLYKLPASEIKDICYEYNKSPYGDTFDKSVARTRKYIDSQMDRWQKEYFNPKPNQCTPQQNRQVNYVDDDEQLIDDFFNHLKNKNIEGYESFLYCDSVGLPTSGPGLQITGTGMLSGFTTSSQPGAITPLNPAHTPKQQQDQWNQVYNYCQDFAKDENGVSKRPAMTAKAQRKEMENMGIPVMYFQDDELEKKTKDYIRQNTLPYTRKQFNNIGLNFDDLTPKQKIANLDIPYTMSPKDYKLGYGSIDDGYWSNYTKALQNGDFEWAAQESHRKGISERRNEIIRDLLLNKDVIY